MAKNNFTEEDTTTLDYSKPIESDDSRIRFAFSDDGYLPAGIGRTFLADVFSIGALIYTAKTIKKDGKNFRVYQTDQAGLEHLFNTMDETLDSINDITEAFGLLLANADIDEIGRPHRSLIGWIIVSFTELTGVIRNEKRQIVKDRILPGLEMSKEDEAA